MATETRPEGPVSSPRPVPREVPPLRNGDRLTGPEFERRYDAMPHLKKAELIDGIVYIPSPDFPRSLDVEAAMSSPVSFEYHSAQHFDLIGWLFLYRMSTPGVRGGDNGTIKLDLDNLPQPDAFLIINPDRGGQAVINEDGYIVGAPELVAEVAFSSVSYDMHAKLNLYRRHNAREYVVWRVEDGGFDWFVQRDGRFERLEPTPDGTYRSEVFPGLWLDPSALIRGDLAAVARVVQAGLATPGHAAFVERLRRAKDARP